MSTLAYATMIANKHNYASPPSPPRKPIVLFREVQTGVIHEYPCPEFDRTPHSVGATHTNGVLVRDLLCRVEMAIGTRRKRPSFFFRHNNLELDVTATNKDNEVADIIRLHNGLPDIDVVFDYVPLKVAYFDGNYQDREALKAYGAKWNCKMKKWYLPEDYQYIPDQDGLYGINTIWDENFAGTDIEGMVMGEILRYQPEPSKHSAWHQKKGRGMPMKAA